MIAFELRNVKCVLTLSMLPQNLIEQFVKRQHNLILRIRDSIILTIYPKQIERVHITGIKNINDFQLIKILFLKNYVKIRKIQINNTFWIAKPMIIPHFHKFALFCKHTYTNRYAILDLSSYGLNGDGYINVIYLRHKMCSGVGLIHRKSSSIIGAKDFQSVKMLVFEIKQLLNTYLFKSGLPLFFHDLNVDDEIED